MQFITNTFLDRQAASLHRRLHKVPFKLEKTSNRLGWYTAWKQDSRYVSTCVYIHGKDGTVVVRYADHHDDEEPVIDRDCEKKFVLDLLAHPMTEAQIVEFVRTHLTPYGSVA
jgi:hypothetical protein